MRELNNLQIGFLLIVILILTAFSINPDQSITGMMYSSSSFCGNNICENDESIGNCAVDCLTGCGDGVCIGSEEYICPDDCLYAPRIVYSQLNGIILFISSLIALLVIFYWIKPITTKKKRPIKRKTKRKRRR
jgi:hypothetical protein